MSYCLFTAYFTIGTVYENLCADIQKYNSVGVKTCYAKESHNRKIIRIGGPLKEILHLSFKHSLKYKSGCKHMNIINNRLQAKRQRRNLAT